MEVKEYERSTCAFKYDIYSFMVTVDLNFSLFELDWGKFD
jgi:hypothetical protein